MSNEGNARGEAIIQRQLNYTQIIMVLGYGGFLTLWSMTYERVPTAIFGICGALLVLSLLAFILSELWMAWGYVRLAARAKAMSQREVDQAADAHSKATAANGPTVFLVAAIPGVFGGAVLLATYLILAIEGRWN